MDILQTLGTAAMFTLAVICGMLSYPDRNPLYIAVGQVVFRWIFFALVFLSVGRVGTFIGLDTEMARFINSAAFLVAVVAITINVFRHTRPRGPKQ
jgi:hypothetical protein